MSIRFGMILGRLGGTGIVHVAGSDASLIGIGTKNGGSDGFWIQNSGSKLSVTIDEGGVTPITVEGWGDGGAFATFETDSILEVDWAAGVTNYGEFDILTWEGDLTDNGLTFGPSVDTNVWSFYFRDADSDGTNDTLSVLAGGGTPNVVPTITSYSYDGSTVMLSWDSEENFDYNVLSKAALHDAWTTNIAAVPGAGATTSTNVTHSGGTEEFFTIEAY
jgi:hypothetical protein